MLIILRFLLAQLYLNSLKYKTSKREINDALKEFKKRRHRELGSDYKHELLDKAYDEAMERINSQMEDRKRLGRKVIAWITCAKRPLSAVELQHVLAVEIGDTELDDDNIRGIEMIRSVCAGLVLVDEKSIIIRLVHYTTQEYFDTKQESLFHDEEVSLAMACVTYLSFNTFESGVCSGTYGLMRRLRQNPFYEYAAKNWGRHVRDVAIEKHELIIDFLMDNAKSSSACQVMMNTDIFTNISNNSSQPRYGLGIHIAAYFGLREAAIILIKNGQDPNVQEHDYGRTPLACAVVGRQNEMVKLLLAVEGIDPNGRDNGMKIPFYQKMISDEEWGVGIPDPMPMRVIREYNALSILMKDGLISTLTPYGTAKFSGAEWLMDIPRYVDPAARPWYWYILGGTPLLYAVWGGMDEIVKILLEDPRVDPNARDRRFGVTPLWHAAGYGHTSIVKLLLEKAGIGSVRKDKIWSPLSIASWTGQTAVVKLLLATEGVDPDLYDLAKQTPSMKAAWQGHDEVFNALLEDGRINLNAKDARGFTPLLMAAIQGHGSIIKLLQSKGDDIDFNAPNKGPTGISPLQWAAQNGREDAVKVLLTDKRVDVNLRNNKWDFTALIIAAMEGHERVVMVLISAEGIDPNYATEGQRETALHHAVKWCNPKVISVLLIHPKIDPNLKDSGGMTPLMRAAIWGNGKGVLEALLQSDTVDINARTVNGQTLLMLAALSRRNEGMIELLLDKGADPDARDNMGRSLLFYLAKSMWFKSFERLVTDERVQLDLKDYYGSTPLSIAARFGNEEVVGLFLATDKVDISSKDDSARTPLWWAMRNRHRRISEMLLNHAKKKSISISDMINYVDFNGCSLKQFDRSLELSITCSACFRVIELKKRASTCRVCGGGYADICFCYNLEVQAHFFDSQHELELWNQNYWDCTSKSEDDSEVDSLDLEDDDSEDDDSEDDEPEDDESEDNELGDNDDSGYDGDSEYQDSSS